VPYLRSADARLHINILIGIPLFALYGALTTELQTKTLVLAAVFYFLTGFGITGGYHRLWSHKGWNAVAPVRFIVLMFGAAALQGSARWWCRNHRAHHKFTDTTKVRARSARVTPVPRMIR